jgi:hypothetical protein
MGLVRGELEEGLGSVVKRGSVPDFKVDAGQYKSKDLENQEIWRRTGFCIFI